MTPASAPNRRKHVDEKHVHRALALASPIERGADVRELQEGVNHSFKHLKIDHRLLVDGDFGQHTFEAAREAALALGATGGEQNKLERRILSEGAQRLLRGRSLTSAEIEAAHARVHFRKVLRDRYDVAGGELAIKRALHLVGVHEIPDGSNWGGKVEQFIKFTGYDGPVYWCGCFADWVVVKLGGAKIPVRIRLGYAPYILDDAQAKTNGLRAVNVRMATYGDLGSLWNGEHVVVVRAPVQPGDTMVKTLEGNTSPTDGDSQWDGGVVAAKERSIFDFDRGLVGRPLWK